MARRMALVATTAVLLSACPASTGPSDGAFHASLSPVTCPADVAVQFLVSYACATLTTLLDRADPAGPTVRSLVVTITPSVISAPDPVLIVGDEGGAVPDYGTHQAEAERLHRVVYVLEQRGTAHGDPSISCPRLDTDPSATVHGVLAAVATCGAELRAEGMDPVDFGASSMAADVEDLRQALGVDAWNVEAFGSAAVLALEVAERYPEHVRAVVIDTPSLPLGASSAEAAATADVFRQLFRSCHAHGACRARYGNLAGVWTAAAGQFRRASVPAWRGPLAVDEAGLVRALRAAVAWDHADVVGFPGTLRAASQGRLDPDLATIRATGGPMCVGFRPACGPGVTTGVALSLLCGDAGLSAPRDAPRVPGVKRAFANDPYRRACAMWTGGVLASTESSRSPVPVLIVSSSLDPFDPPWWSRALARPLGRSTVMIVDGVDRQLLMSNPCATLARIDWLDRPERLVNVHCRATVFGSSRDAA